MAQDLRARLAAFVRPLELLRLDFAVEPDRGCRRYRLGLEIDTGPVDGGVAPRAWAGAVRAVEARGVDPSGGPAEGILLGWGRQAWPATSRFLTGLWSILDLVEREGSRHRLRLNSSRDPEALAARFPGLARLVDRLGDLLSVELSMVPRKGGPPDELVLRSADAWIEWSADLDPARATGRGEWEGAFSADLSAAGISARLHDLPFSLEFDPAADSLRVRAAFDRRPRHLEVAGRLLSPAARDLFRARLDLDWGPRDGANRLRVEGEADLVLPDLLLEAGERTAALLAERAGESSGELERYARDLLGALLADAGAAPGP